MVPLIVTEPYLKHHGNDLVDNGYEIVPIKPGTKYPDLPGWQNADARELLPKWLGNGHANSGIGILTKHTPAIDIDCHDQEMVDATIDKIEEVLGECVPTRIGNAPKTLLVCRTNEPFKKVTSKRYQDAEGRQHQLEILGDGQQFVAYAIHPDTNAPYFWTTETTPINTRTEELPRLTLADARELVTWFDDNVPFEWIEVGAGTQGLPSNPLPHQDAFDRYKPPLELTDEQIDKTLSYVDPETMDHDGWVQVGMSIHHQFEGGLDGLDRWKAWSSRDLDRYDEAECAKRWKSFHPEGRDPVTFASVVKLAKQSRLKETLDAGPFKFYSPQDLEAFPPPPHYLVDGVIEAEKLGVGYGEPGSGKSFWALDIGMHVASGKDWHGKTVEQTPVAYIAGEGITGLRRRIHAWRRHHNADMPPLYLSQGAADLVDPDALKDVVQALETFKPGLIFVDTLARNFTGDENSTQDMGLFVNTVSKYLKEELDAAVIIIHHTAKGNPNAARGSGALKGAADFEFQISQPTPNYMKLYCDKMKDDEDQWTMWFKLNKVSFAQSMEQEGDKAYVSLVPTLTEAPVEEVKVDTTTKTGQIQAYIKEMGSVNKGELTGWALDNNICTRSTVWRTVKELCDTFLVEEIEDTDGGKRVNWLGTDETLKEETE